MMALGASKKSEDADTSTCALEDILTCMLDFEPLKDPKVLQCGHTFCLECLEKIAALRRGQDQDPSHLPCPICTQPTLIPSGMVRNLPDNITIRQLRDMGQTVLMEMQQYQDKDKTVVCHSCSSNGTGPDKERSVRYFCYKCSEHYCQHCFRIHALSFKDHTEVVDLCSNVKDMLQVFCSKHSKYVKYYCQQCSQGLCTLCRMHDHPKNHWIVDIADKDTIIQKRAEIRKLRPVVEQNLAEANRRSELLQGVRKNLYSYYADLDSQLLQCFRKTKEAAMQRLEDWYQRLETERIQRKTVFEKQLNITQEDLNFHVSSCQSLAGFVDHVLEEDASFQPLSLYSDLQARMSTLDRFLPDLDHVNSAPVGLLAVNTRCLDTLGQPGWLHDGQLDITYQDGKVTMSPSPRTPKFKGTFFGEETPPGILVPISTPHDHDPGWSPVSGSSGSISISSASLFPSPDPLRRSISENYMLYEDEPEEDPFSRESAARASTPGRIKGDNSLQRSDRAKSEMAIGHYKKHEQTPRSRHKSSSSSLLSSLFRRSFGLGKKKKERPQLSVPKEEPKKPKKPSVDNYSMLWQKAGDVVGSGNASTQAIRFLTGACYSDDGSWFLADNISSKIMSYDATTTNRKSIFTVETGFKPWGVAVVGYGEGTAGMVHCTDLQNRCMQVFIADGTERVTSPAFSWGMGDMFNPHGICFNPFTSKLVVSDLSPSGPTLHVADLDGRVVTHISSMYGSGETQMKYPWYIASDSHGRIYVSDRDNSAVKVFDMDGHFVTRFKHKLGCPAGITVDPMGFILVADRSGNHNIAMFTPDGQFVGNLKTKDDVSWPQALCSDPYNMIMVTEYLENSLTTLKCFGK